MNQFRVQINIIADSGSRPPDRAFRKFDHKSRFPAAFAETPRGKCFPEMNDPVFSGDEQQIQLLSNLQLGFGIAALLFLALAIFLFFYLHIPQVFNEYRGKSAQKAMEEMAANSSDSGRIVSMDKKSKNKKKGTGQLVQRRHYTDNLTDDLSGRMSQEFGEPTGQMNLNMANSSEANGMMQETAANGSEATDVLDPSMIANPVQERQHVSTPEQEGTMVLDPNMLQHSNSTFEIERSIILIHTEKAI